MPHFEIGRAQWDFVQAPFVLELGEEGVAFDFALDDAEVEVGAAVEELGVDLRAADDE